MKMKFITVLLAVLLVFTACTNDTDDYVPQEYTYSYPSWSVGTSMNFTPTGLPAEITYTLTSDTPAKTFNTASGFTGTLNVNDGPYANFTTSTFIQTFYKNGKVVGSQVVKVTFALDKFDTLLNTSDVSITSIPDVKLTY